jgi:hypothetical protein
MGFDIQTWLPLVTVTLAAAICLSVASFIMGSTKLPLVRGVTTGTVMLRVCRGPSEDGSPSPSPPFGRLNWRNWRRLYETKHDPRM